MRLFVVMLVMAITASTQAMAFGPRHQRDTRKAEVNEGCSAAFYRGSGGNLYTTRITPNLTVPIRTGHRAIILSARNILRDVATDSRGGRVSRSRNPSEVSRRFDGGLICLCH